MEGGEIGGAPGVFAEFDSEYGASARVVIATLRAFC